AGKAALSVCAACLGRFQHNVHLCNPSTLWNGESTHVTRDQNGRLINPSGAELCLKWQLPRQCTNSSHPERHLCSGCGEKSHGAQDCPRAQKN
ncbi:hypothetical protein C8F01DRAFT_919474, partial [Mycena amicta]